MHTGIARKALSAVLTLTVALDVAAGGFQTNPTPLLVPASWGRVTSLSGNSPGRFILIADVHSDAGVHRNIALLLRLLRRQDVAVVAMEGAWGPIDTGYIKSMPDAGIAGDIARFWLSLGILTGAESAAVLSSKPITLVGVDDRKLYRKSLNAMIFGLEHNSRMAAKLRRSSAGFSASRLPEDGWTSFLSGRGTLSGYLRTVLTFFPPECLPFLGGEILVFLRDPSSQPHSIQKLWNEVETLRVLVQERRARNAPHLVEIRRAALLDLMMRLVRFEMTRRDWENYCVYRKWRERHGGSSSGAQHDRALIRRMSAYESFYRLSERRDRALFKHLLRLGEAHPGRDVVLITGGFHIPGIVKRLQRIGRSYAVIVPNAAAGGGAAFYHRVLTGQSVGLENYFRQFAHASAGLTLAPQPRLAFDGLTDPGLRRAFSAACAALHDFLVGAKTDDPVKALEMIREMRGRWKANYRESLMDQFKGDVSRVNTMMSFFDDFNVSDYRRDGEKIIAEVRLFGLNTRMELRLSPGRPGEVLRLDVSGLAPLFPMDFSGAASPSHGVVRRSLLTHFPHKLEAEPDASDPVRDYVAVFNRAVELKSELTRDAGWRKRGRSFLASSDRPSLEDLYGALAGPAANRPAFLRYLKKEFQDRGIDVEFEIVEADDARLGNRILAAEGTKIFIAPSARMGDLLFFFAHEMAHIGGGDELMGRRQDVEAIAVLKGIAQALRKTARKHRDGIADVHYLTVKADLLELEALDWELDLHTARLERLGDGQAFLKRHSLGRFEDASGALLESMGKAVHGVIKAAPVKLDRQVIMNSLGDKGSALLERRRRFDTALLKYLVGKAVGLSLRGYLSAKQGAAAREDSIKKAGEKAMKGKAVWHVSKGFLYVLVASVLFGFTPVLAKSLIEQHATFAVLVARELIVAIVLTPFIISKKIPNPTWKQALVIAALGVVLTAIGDPLYYGGLRLTSPLAAFLMFSTGHLVSMIIASRIFFKEKLTVRKWIGAGLTLIGAFLIGFTEATGSLASPVLGMIMVLGAAVTSTAWTIMAKNILKNVNPIVLIAITYWAGLPVMLALSGGNLSLMGSPLVWVFGLVTAVAYMLYYKGLKWISAVTASLLDLTSPMFTALFSALHRLRFPGWHEVGSLILTTLGVVTFIGGRSKDKPVKRKVLEARMDDWMKFGKSVAENLESFMIADHGITIPSAVDLSELEKDYGPSDVLEALSYYLRKSNVPNADVFEMIFKRLGAARALKFLLDAKEDIEHYLGRDIPLEERAEEEGVLKAIEEEIQKRFSFPAPMGATAPPADSRVLVEKAA